MVGDSVPWERPAVTLSFEQGEAPAHDSFGTAKQISALPFTDTIALSFATSDPNDPRPSCEFGQPLANVAYRFTATSSASLAIRSQSGSYYIQAGSNFSAQQTELRV